MKLADWNYWNQKAATWVSVAVLAGGLVTAFLCFFILRIDIGLQDLATSHEIIEETI